MVVGIGNAYLIPSGPDDGLHLSIVCTGEKARPDFRLLVNITSIKTGKFYDATCVIKAGEHPFIRHDSYVSYRHSSQCTSSKIERSIERGIYVPKEDVSIELLKRIIEGFYLSEFTSPWVIEILE